MDGIDDQRRERRRQIPIRNTCSLLPAGAREFVPAAQEYSVFGKTGNDDMPVALRLPLKHGQQILSRTCCSKAPLCIGLPCAKHSHALHEELVEVRGKDRQELRPLQQRRALIQRLGQDSLVEVQPAQVPIDPHLLQSGGQGCIEYPMVANGRQNGSSHSKSSLDETFILRPGPGREV